MIFLHLGGRGYFCLTFHQFRQFFSQIQRDYHYKITAKNCQLEVSTCLFIRFQIDFINGLVTLSGTNVNLCFFPLFLMIRTRVIVHRDKFRTAFCQ